jgi:hypothetical protein
MTTGRTSSVIGQPATYKKPTSGATLTDGAAIHPRFLRVGPWVLSLVVATLFVLSFATSYAALHGYALQLDFGPEFAIVFPLVLDAVISVLAVTVLLERALRRRTITIKGWQVTLRWPTWPLTALWIYFGGSVAGNVAHAPPILPAQLVAAVPPISAALTFHLLLRLLDRAPALREIAEAYEERNVEERERAALRKARRDRIKARDPGRPHSEVLDIVRPPGRVSGHETGEGYHDPRALPDSRPSRTGNGTPGRRVQPSTDAASTVTEEPRSSRPNGASAVELEELRRRVAAAIDAGHRVTGETVGRWLGVSARTGRRRLSALLHEDPALAKEITGNDPFSDAPLSSTA